MMFIFPSWQYLKLYSGHRSSRFASFVVVCSAADVGLWGSGCTFSTHLRKERGGMGTSSFYLKIRKIRYARLSRPQPTFKANSGSSLLALLLCSSGHCCGMGSIPSLRTSSVANKTKQNQTNHYRYMSLGGKMIPLSSRILYKEGDWDQTGMVGQRNTSFTLSAQDGECHKHRRR